MTCRQSWRLAAASHSREAAQRALRLSQPMLAILLTPVPCSQQHACGAAAYERAWLTSCHFCDTQVGIIQPGTGIELVLNEATQRKSSSAAGFNAQVRRAQRRWQSSWRVGGASRCPQWRNPPACLSRPRACSRNAGRARVR